MLLGRFGMNNILTSDFEYIASHFDEIDFLKKKKWLITGANGMLGSYLTLFLVFLNTNWFAETDRMQIAVILNKMKNHKNSTIWEAIKEQHLMAIYRDLSTDFKLRPGEYDYIVHSASPAHPISIFHRFLNKFRHLHLITNR